LSLGLAGGIEHAFLTRGQIGPLPPEACGSKFALTGRTLHTLDYWDFCVYVDASANLPGAPGLSHIN